MSYITSPDNWVVNKNESNTPEGGVENRAIIENSQIISSNFTIETGRNAVSAGPITVNSGVTVTVPSGSVWTIV